ncbi:MAG: hypothetical protein ACPL2N_03655 [Candidatus Cryosericum sp.]
MLIQVSMNNIESIEQGEEILTNWHYHLDEDQSHVVLEREVAGATIRVFGLHPWAEELEGEDEGLDGEHDEEMDDVIEDEDGSDDDEEGQDDEDDEDGDEESEIIYLGQALFSPLEEQARVLAGELLEEDYIGTVSVSTAEGELTGTDAFRALPADTKAAVIAALEELGDVEAYLSLYEVMGFEI